MKKSISYSLALSAILAITGCGGSDDTTDEIANSTNTATGYYLDSAVSGAEFSCGSQVGVTDTDGKFTFEKGQDCTFSLGGIELRKVEANLLADGGKIVETNVKVAAMLQSLDTDKNPDNGITISDSVVQAFKKSLQDNNITTVPTSTQLQTVLTEIAVNVDGFTDTIVTEDKALAHLRTTQAEVLKDLLSNKTFYVVGTDDSDIYLGKYTLDEDLTEGHWEGLINDKEDNTDVISGLDLVGNKLYGWNENSDYITIEQQATLIVAYEYNSDGSAAGKDYIFTTLDAATDYYNSLQKEPTTADFDLNSLVGKSLYQKCTYNDTEIIETLTFGSSDKLTYSVTIDGEEEKSYDTYYIEPDRIYTYEDQNTSGDNEEVHIFDTATEKQIQFTESDNTLSIFYFTEDDAINGPAQNCNRDE
jgi:hypothetical protein